MGNITWTEVALVALIVATLAIVAIGSIEAYKEFKAACELNGGITVFDGRAYDCIQRRAP